MASGVFVNESGRILVSLFFWIGKRVTTLLPIFFYHKLAQSLLTMGLGRVVTPPGQVQEHQELAHRLGRDKSTITRWLQKYRRGGL